MLLSKAKKPLCKHLAIATLLASVPGVQAVNSYTWSAVGPNNNWSTPANWVGSAVPPSASQAYIAAHNQSIVSNLDTDYPALSPLYQLNLQATSAGSVTFNQTGHFLYVSPNAGENYSLSLAASSNSNLTYNLSGGTLGLTSAAPFVTSGSFFNLSGTSALLSANSEQFRDSTFTQTGSSHSYDLISLISSSYILSAGSLSGNTLALTAGTFTQSGGTHTISGLASLTTQAGPGAYFLQNGNLTAGLLAVGPTSAFSQTGGTVSASSFSQIGGTTTLDGPQSLYAFPSFSFSAGTFALASSTPKTLVTQTFSVTNTAKLDLTNGNIILRDNPPGTPPLNSLMSALNTGKIFSSTVAPPDSLAVIKAADYLTLYGPSATFAGQSLGSNDAILTHALVGDADLSGRITMNDYAQLDAAFFFGNFDGINKIANWINGDFNHDGKIDYQDYALIDSAFSNQSLANDMIQEHITEFGQPYLSAFTRLASTSVPEPTSIAFLVLATGPLLLRKRAPASR